MPARRFRKEDYDPVDKVPDGLSWKPAPGPSPGSRRGPRKEPSPFPWVNKARERQRRRRTGPAQTVLLSLGNLYKLVRDRDTGAVQYFKHKSVDAPISPAATIDAEPTRGHQVRYRQGALCWFVDNGRWFLVKVVKREPHRITIASETGWDADRQKEWALGVLLEFPAPGALFKRLRPLKDRYV